MKINAKYQWIAAVRKLQLTMVCQTTDSGKAVAKEGNDFQTVLFSEIFSAV
jgi:hypothetical protein